jgi:hypothetical protein
VDIPIVTGLGEARNNVNVLSSAVVFACGMGPGTASEVALAIKARREVVLVEVGDDAERFFVGLDPDLVHIATGIDDAIAGARRILQRRTTRTVDT